MYILPIKSTDRVLEIGSGHNPHPRSDVLCDRYLYDDQERQRMAIRFDRPLIIAQGEHLPFRNKAFDFVLCSQVLEHTHNPVTFAKEISRVGKAGLVIVPHATREKLFGWSYHRWLFYEQHHHLNCMPKPAHYETPLAGLMHRLHARSLIFRRFTKQHERELNIYFYWKKKLSIQRSRRPQQIFSQKIDKSLKTMIEHMDGSWQEDLRFGLKESVERLRNKWHNVHRMKGWNQRTAFDPYYNYKSLLSLIHCVQCHRRLSKSSIIAKKITCPHCKTVYPLVNNIPILLKPEELKKGY